MPAVPLLVLVGYAGLVWLMLKWTEPGGSVRRGWLAVLLASVPTVSFAVAYSIMDGDINEGTGAFYFVPLMFVAVPYLGVVLQALVMLRHAKEEDPGRGLALLVASAGLLILPWALMTIQLGAARNG
jgi:cytochrome bd-type quinol oxidase subunit 2